MLSDVSINAESLLWTRSHEPFEMMSSLKRHRSDDDQVAPPAQDGGARVPVCTAPSLVNVLGALQRSSWSLQHTVVARFLSHHLPAAAALCSDDAPTTVTVILVL
jgi:hypothetical protein